jgi:predicted HTH domain antitoxin
MIIAPALRCIYDGGDTDMSKIVFEVEVPNAIHGTQLEAKYLDAAQKLFQEQTVVRLFEQGDISSGYAAEMLGITKQEFIKLLSKHGVSFFNFTDDEWRNELENVARVQAQLEAENRTQP